MQSKRSIRFPVRTDVDMSMQPDRQRGGYFRPVIGGYIDVELPVLSSEEAPLSIRHINEDGVARTYRAWEGHLLSPVQLGDEWVPAQLDVEELLPGEYEVNVRRPGASEAGHFYTFPYRSYFNYMNWTGGLITVDEDPMRYPEFVAAANWTREELEDVVLVDGIAWAASAGPRIIALPGKGAGGNGNVLKAFPLGPEMRTATIDATRIFSIFDAEHVLDAFRETFPGIASEVGQVEILSETQWDRASISGKVAFESLRRLAVEIDEILQDFGPQEVPIAVLEASLGVKDAWEQMAIDPHKEEHRRRFHSAMGDLVSSVKEMVPESRRRRWIASLDVADRCQGYDALVGFGLG